jgi:hypothetical protein
VIILDTNIISALMSPQQDGPVRDWLNAQAQMSLWTTSVNVLEINAGILLLPDGRRKDELMRRFAILMSDVLGDRVLPFDLDAAMQASRLYAMRHRRGLNKETRDTQIAGIALSRRAAIATRNLRDFEDLDIPLLNPWTD